MSAAPPNRLPKFLTRVPCEECQNDSIMAGVVCDPLGRLHLWTPARQSRARQAPVLAEALGDQGKWRTAPFAWPIPDDLGPTIATVSCARSGHIANLNSVLAARNARAGAPETPSEPLHVESKDCSHTHVRFAIDLAYLDPNRLPPGH